MGNRPSIPGQAPGSLASQTHFVGAVDDFALWNRPLTTEEVHLLYSADTELGTASPTKSPTKSPSTSPTQNPTKAPSPVLPWSDPSSWDSGSVPSGTGDVTIPDGTVIAIDVSW